MNICNFDIFRRTEASPESVTPRLFKPPTHSSLIYCFSSIFFFPLLSGLATQFTYTAKLHSSILFICFSFLSVENSFYFVLESCCSSIFLFICRAMSSLYPQGSGFSPARNIPSPHLRNNSDVESQYLTELLTERQKLGPFMQILPICNRLLDQEILRVSGRISNRTFADYDRLQHCSPGPLASSDIMPDIGGKGIWNGNSWSCIQPERFGIPQGMSMDWQPAHGSPSSVLVKKRLHLEIPVDRYPTFNFVGRLLGPRGNSLKRVEASTGCRVFIRGKGSIKDPEKEESLRGKPGYEHLSDPLHILIEADLPANIIDGRLKQAKEIIEELLKPVDESQDLYKRQQLRELAMLNNIREESPQPRGSVSPFTSSGMKRAKISW